MRFESVLVYRQAFLREYKKALGEKVEEGPRGLCLKIVGPGCPACDRLEQTIMTVLWPEPGAAGRGGA